MDLILAAHTTWLHTDTVAEPHQKLFAILEVSTSALYVWHAGTVSSGKTQMPRQFLSFLSSLR